MSSTRRRSEEKERQPLRIVQHLRALGVALAVGALVWGLSSAGGAAPREGAHALAFKGLRLLRHAVRGFERQHGFLPGSISFADGAVEALPEPGRSALVAGQLTDPRDEHGYPAWDGVYRGLLQELPVNPFTGSREIVVVPRGEDATAFAAGANAGWAYVAEWGHDAAGPLPPGTVLPCGRTAESVDLLRGGVHTVQEIAFEIEDFQRWR